MTNGEFYEDFNDQCPVHKTGLNREYNFGYGTGDAAVYTFTGCGCAVCVKMDGFKNKPQYFTSYTLAAGAARMSKAIAKARW